jgi:hypothetical protein
MPDDLIVDGMVETGGQRTPLGPRLLGGRLSVNVDDRRKDPRGATRLKDQPFLGDFTFLPALGPGGDSPPMLSYDRPEFTWNFNNPPPRRLDTLENLMRPEMLPGFVEPRTWDPSLVQKGLLRDKTAGRTDRLPIQVMADSYVIPADVVSGIGQGNTEAGGEMLDKMVGSLATGFKRGGAAKVRNPVQIVAAGGEYIVPPEAVDAIGGGDPAKGHRILDTFVKHLRVSTAKKMMKLPGPRRD